MQNGNDVTRYKIEHRTLYNYSEPVAVCQNQLRMMPAPRPDVICHDTQLEILPTPVNSDEHRDYFGNRVISFAIESIHHSLEIIARSDVSIRSPLVTTLAAPNPLRQPSGAVNPPGGPDISLVSSNPTQPSGFSEQPISDFGESWESVAAQIASPQSFNPLVDQQRFDSPRIRRSDTFAAYAADSFTPGRGILDAALDFTRRIFRDFRYDTTATTVDTVPEEAFAGKAGVCQDFAQFAIACLRSIGLSANYVSGYLRTIPPPGKPRLIGADESHAWFGIYSGPKYGWVGFDPTNGTLVGSDHIPICIGRDYGDISPMRGVVLGGGHTTLKVSVDVQPMAFAQQQAMQQ